MDMDKAEDDEIVLQEVIVEQNNTRAKAVVRSNSLQIPGTSADPKKDTSSKVGTLFGLSPKIAPKFPREKLKSMFKKRKLSAALPFYKIKGVRFIRGTKDDEESESESLLNISDEPVEVAITLSSPELTEAEKESGTHPYYFTQQTITSSKQLPTERAFTIRQSSLTRSESEEDKISKALKVKMYIPRCSSMPNIQRSDSIIPYIHDPIIASSLKKISKAEQKKKSKRKSKRRKSPPLRPDPFPDDTSDHSGRELRDGTELASETDSTTRRNTLPEITLTKCDHHASDHLDLAVSPNHSSNQSSAPGMQESTMQTLPSRTEEESFHKPTASTEKHITSDKAPEQHSKPTGDSPKHRKVKSSTVQKEPIMKKDEPRTATQEQHQAFVIIPIEDDEETPTASSGDVQKHHSRPRKAPSHLKLQIKPDSKESTVEAESKLSPTGAVRKEPPQSPVRTPPSEPPTRQSYKTFTEKTPEVHSIPTLTTRESAPSSDGISKRSQPKRKSPPPPRSPSPSPIRPDTLRFATKRGSVSSKKIAGISLAPTKPRSPTTDIPRGKKVESPLFPKPLIKLTTPSQSSPTIESPVTPETPKYLGAEFPKDIQESEDQKSRKPPDAPKRHRPHSSSKEKK